MNDPVTVTICGAPSRETLAALLDLAVQAGLGLVLQPRTAPPVLALAAVVETVDAPKARKPVKRAKRKPATLAAKKSPLPVSHTSKRPAPVVVAPVAGRTYAPKPCAACSKPFTPSGPRAKFCGKCVHEPVSADDGLEVAWSGGCGAPSLTGERATHAMRF